MWVVAVFGVTVLISLLLLCVGCREKKKPSGNGALPDSTAALQPQTSVKENQAAVNGSHDHSSLSRHSSLSSRGSVRITITNMVDPGDVENLDSPGCTSQHSGGGNSMADRELPKLPPPQEVDDNDHDYDILDEQKLPFCSVTPPPASFSTVDYDTIDNLAVDYTTLPRGSDAPDYMTVRKETTISFPSTSGQCRPAYEAIPDVVRRQSYSELHSTSRHSHEEMPGEARRPSYECLPEMNSNRPVQLGVDKSATIGPIGRSSRPFSLSEVYDAPGKPISKSRAGSERKPRDNEDTVSVIYASINPEFRTKRQESLDKQDYKTLTAPELEPPVPENPYAMLDNLLEDLQIPNPDYITPTNNNNNSEITDDRIYEDLENMRPNSDCIEELLTPYSAARRTNPIIMKSSPYAVSNTSNDTPSASPICFVEQNDGLK